MASRSIRLGDAKVAVAGGTENMSRVPYFLTAQRWGHSLGDVVAQGPAGHRRPDDRQAARGAGGRGGRRVRDHPGRAGRLGCAQPRATTCAARDAGKFADEIMPIAVPQPKGEPIVFTEDESVRPGTTVEKLAALPTIYGSPTVTAGNAPGLNTGASAMVLMSPDEAAPPRHEAARHARRLGDGLGPSRPHRVDPGRVGPARAREGRPDDRRHGPDRDQRGVRRGPPRLDPGHGRRRPGEGRGASGPGRTSTAAPSRSATRPARPARDWS